MVFFVFTYNLLPITYYLFFIKGVVIMLRHFTLEYWKDEGWYVGRLKEVPGIFSQGESLQELEENIKEAYQLMMAEEETAYHANIKTKELEVEV